MNLSALCTNGAQPHDATCPCGCARTFRVTASNPRQVYYSDKCRDRVNQAKARAKYARRAKTA
jgi:hypothetical protein